jgi:hypothetical protein
MFKFNDQLSVGGSGEELFLSLHPWLNKADGIKFDFERDGKTVELKTDTYSMKSTKNFFMERYSDTDRGTPGGPWRAAKDNVSYFVYMYLPQRTCFWFDSKQLVSFLDEYCKDQRLVEIPNKTWLTTGFLVPRTAVKHLILKTSGKQ